MPSNPAGQAAYGSLLKPVFDAAGIPVTAVEVTDPGATAADVQAAMTAAGAGDGRRVHPARHGAELHRHV